MARKDDHPLREHITGFCYQHMKPDVVSNHTDKLAKNDMREVKTRRPHDDDRSHTDELDQNDNKNNSFTSSTGIYEYKSYIAGTKVIHTSGEITFLTN